MPEHAIDNSKNGRGRRASVAQEPTSVDAIRLCGGYPDGHLAGCEHRCEEPVLPYLIHFEECNFSAVRGYLLRERTFQRGNPAFSLSAWIWTFRNFKEDLWQRLLRQESNLQAQSSSRRGGIPRCSSHYFWG